MSDAGESTYEDELLAQLDEHVMLFMRMSRPRPHTDSVVSIDTTMILLRDAPARHVDAVANLRPVEVVHGLGVLSRNPPTLAAMCAVSYVRANHRCSESGNCTCWRCTHMSGAYRNLMHAASVAMRTIATASNRLHADMTLLHVACTNGSPDAAEKLLSWGANPNAYSAQHGCTPLYCAMYLSQTEIKQRNAAELVRLLIRHGASVHTGAHISSQPLHIAVMLGLPECARVLMQHGARADAQMGTVAETILGSSIMTHSFAMTRVLLQCGANMDLMSFREWMMCEEEAKREHADDIVALLNKSKHAAK